ncbi:hypothetical protein C8Q72DRAFT_475999 [Fomitopsis betulina]|nr:hypothetical protein C8Q72DRAFT_475999 [Fomitopsis betulina]
MFDESLAPSSSEVEGITPIDFLPSQPNAPKEVDQVQPESTAPVFQTTPVELYEVMSTHDDYLHEYRFVRSYHVRDDEEDDDIPSTNYEELAEDITDEVERHHTLVLSGSDPKVAQKVAQIRLDACITLSFDLDLEASSEGGGSSQCMQEHLLACGMSSSLMSAYIYYLGFLEHVFHATARMLDRLKKEGGSADAALKLWPDDTTDPCSRRELQQAIVRAHANAIREEFPELASGDADVDVAENLAFIAFRKLSTTLPLYLQQDRRRSVPTFVLVFQGVDALAKKTLGDGTRDTLLSDISTARRHVYTLLDPLFAALQLFSEDGLRPLFHLRDTGFLLQELGKSTPVSALSCRARRHRWPPLSSRGYRSAIKAQRPARESASSDSDSDCNDEDPFGSIRAAPASLPNTPSLMSQTSSKMTSEALSKSPSTPPIVIVASCDQKSAPLKRGHEFGNCDTPRTMKRFKVDIISSTAPRLTRQMQAHTSCEAS